MNSSRDKEHVGTQFLKIGVTTAQLSPLLNPVSFLIKRVFIPSFVMLYTEILVCGIVPGFCKSGHICVGVYQPVSNGKVIPGVIVVETTGVWHLLCGDFSTTQQQVLVKMDGMYI